MSTRTISNLGQAGLTGDLDALFQTVFAGEVLTAYARKTVTDGLHYVRRLKGKKAESFPLVGNADVNYHAVAGEEVASQKIEHNERIIALDRPMIASVEVDDWEDMVNHYEVRSKYANALGESLAITSDAHVMIQGLRAARGLDRYGNAVNTVSGMFSGEVIADDNLKLGAGGAASYLEQANALANAVLDAEVAFEEKNIPDSARKVCIIRPQLYSVMFRAAQEGNAPWLNRDFGGGSSFNGIKNPLVVGDTVLVKSNNLPNTNIAAGGDDKWRYYNGDFSSTVGLIMTEDAVGTAKLMDVGFEKERDVRHQCDLLVARRAEGHDTLRPECAVELKLDTLTNA